MKKLYLLLSIAFSAPALAGDLENEIKSQLNQVASLYSDGYAGIYEDSINTKVLEKEEDGYCLAISSFTMESFGAANNASQFIVISECTVPHLVAAPAKKLYVSGIFPYYTPKTFISIESVTMENGKIIVSDKADKKKVIYATQRNSRFWVEAK